MHAAKAAAVIHDPVHTRGAHVAYRATVRNVPKGRPGNGPVCLAVELSGR
jgi:hypothetical protein